LIASRQDIIDGVQITDIAEKYGLDIFHMCAGNFDYKCRCPSPAHKSGSERTSSLFINSINNDFHCFGCSAGTNVIDFYMICEECSFAEALESLRAIIDPELITGESRSKVVVNTLPEMLKISKFFNNLLRYYPDDKEWIFSLMEKTDSYLFDIDNGDNERVIALHAQVRAAAIKRFK